MSRTWLDIGEATVRASEVRLVTKTQEGGWARCTVGLASGDTLLGTREYELVVADLLDMTKRRWEW